MHVVHTIGEVRAALATARSAGSTIGLVPTMGYLHQGHCSLVDASVADGHMTLVTVFVNPLQFAPTEDLAAYPRDLDADVAKVANAGAKLVFAPSVEEMYPEPSQTAVTVSGVSEGMEGASRRTHFAGVATVVAKLFAIVGPCAAYFGEKDYQQLAVIRRMVRDLNFEVDVRGCPTQRAEDGLALSSRNVYLSDEERRVAPVLHRALVDGAAMIRNGERSAEVVRTAMAATIAAEPLAELDYVEVADGDTLQPQSETGANSRLFGAVRFGSARLIDNVGVEAG